MLALLKLSLVLGLIIVLQKYHWDLGLTLFLGALGIGLLFGRPLLALGQDAFHVLTDSLTWRLTGAVVLVLFLGEAMRRTASLQGLVHALETLIADNRLILPVIPALIGLLPMIGGAIFSAPLVDEVGNTLGLSPARKTYINFWFRHIWEYLNPMAPAFILATGIFGVSVPTLMGALYPLALAAVAIGIVVGLRRIPRPATDSQPGPTRQRESLEELGRSIWPIALVIFLAIGLRVDFLLSLGVTVLLLAALHHIPLRELAGMARRSVPPHTVALVLGVMYFKETIETSGAVIEVPDALAQLGIAPLVVIFAVPALVGFLTGALAGAFGVSLPLVLPLISQDAYMTQAMLAYAGGMAGIMLSPLHLCLALTKDYFKSPWGPIYRLLVPSVALETVAAMLLVIA